MATLPEAEHPRQVLAFAQLREDVGLPPLAGGLPSQPFWVAPANARSDNPGEISVMEVEIPATLALSNGKGRRAAQLLKSFSWLEEAPDLLTPVVDQGTCGCCWAVAVTGCLNDRLAVRYGRNPLLLFQQLMACTPSCELCHACGVGSGFETAASDGVTPFLSLDLGAPAPKGGAGRTEEVHDRRGTAAGAKSPSAGHDLEKALAAARQRFARMSKYGIPNGQSSTGSRTATTGGGLLPTPNTELGAASGAAATRHATAPVPGSGADTAKLCLNVSGALFAAPEERLLVRGSLKRSPSVLALQSAILHYGPVITIMRVYADFIVGSDPRLGSPFASTDGVYIHRHGEANYGVPPHKNRDLGTHCMVIVGWGSTPSGILFWIVRNSWGLHWGSQGYCRIAATNPALGNELVGVDLSVTTVLNNVTTSRYGNVWIVPRAEWSKKVYGGGPALTRTSARRLLEGEPSRLRRALILALPAAGLLLVCLCCMWRLWQAKEPPSLCSALRVGSAL
jgi:hypothetical protein